MKLRFAALATAALFTSTAAFAGVVTSGSNIDFLAIDGQKASKSLLKSQNAFTATEGQQHQVVVRVTEIIKSGSDHSLFESVPVIVTFQGTAEDVVISAPRISTLRDANNFQQSPKVFVKTVSGQEVPSKQDVLPQEGFLPNANIVENLSNYNSSGSAASVSGLATSSAPALVAGSAKAQKGKIIVQGENIVEQQLQYWFQQADQETQKRFLNWAAKRK